MYGSHPTYMPSPLEANNNASKAPCFANCYGNKNLLHTVVSGYSGFIPSPIGINCELVNRIDSPFECNVGCNVSNLTTKKLAPIQCAQLNQTINDQATKLRLRSELPHLTRKDVAQVRLPFHELLCNELLENGYHYAFSELFSLYEQQNEQRRVAGPDSPLWYIPPLAEQSEKIALIAYHLSEGEAAARRRDAHTVFTSYLTLGLNFGESPDDLWLAEHFFRYALVAAQNISDDDGLKLALAHQHYGRTLQRRGNLEMAAENLSEFYRVTRDKLWRNESGELLQKLAAVYLVENYQLQIDKCPEEYHSDRINLCRKAHEIAIECGDWKIEAPVWLRLGQLLEAAGNLEEAFTVFRELFDKACINGDYLTLTRVCEALAKLCQRMNNVEESIKYLQKFASSCERHGQWIELGRACQMLGTAYDTIGDFSAALKWMKKAYNMPHMIQGLKPDACKETTEASRIMIGVTRAHLMHNHYCHNLLKNIPPAVQKIVGWKARPKDEETVFHLNEIQLPPITFESRNPKRSVLTYAKHPATEFLYR